jgi:hypothetical protein
MKSLRAFLSLLAVLMALPAVAAEGVTVTPTLVKSGFYRAEDCVPTMDVKLYDECVCEASIKKAQITGPAAEVMSSINQSLSMLPEKLAAESCEGKPTTPPTAGLKVNTASADYEIAYQTPTTLTALIKYSTYGVGSDHPLDGTEGFTFDLASGQLVDAIAHLKPEEIKKADSFIKSELLKKYPAALYDEVKTRTDPYLTENGCDSCTLFYGKDGWVVRFQLTAIAPYMIGEPEVVLPTDIIAAPEQLLAKG